MTRSSIADGGIAGGSQGHGCGDSSNTCIGLKNPSSKNQQELILYKGDSTINFRIFQMSIRQDFLA